MHAGMLCHSLGQRMVSQGSAITHHVGFHGVDETDSRGSSLPPDGPVHPVHTFDVLLNLLS